MLSGFGAEPVLAPIARDTRASLDAALEAARGADLIVTLGGASVGDHDLVRDALGDEQLDFYKVALRPGKPLMAGRVRGAPMIGLPGNPVSALVCGHVFLRPALDALLGLPAGPLPRSRARLAHDLAPGGPREHYMRATLASGDEGPTVAPFDAQDSSMLSRLSAADCLMVQPPHAPAMRAGTMIDVIALDA
jgi:molybdopterin molybdotransferase